MSRNKRMDAFARETFRLGSLQGFRHFSVELRGREELLLTVHCKSSARSPPSASSSCGSPHSLPRGNSGGSSTSNPQGLPPYLQPEQPNARLVTMRESPSGPLPPASPCQRDPLRRTFDDEGESPSAVFLVGGYAHYNCPYVWVREGHGLLGSFASEASFDAPLQLQSVAAWPSRTVYVWEIVAELVQAVVRAPPSNPFELAPGVAAAFASQRPASDAMLASAALAHFLRELYLSRSQFSRAVEGDYLDVVEAHVRLLPPLAASLNDDRRSASFGGSVSGESPARGGGSMIS